MKCKICSNSSEAFLKAGIFNESLNIEYYKCSSCGFIQTEEPYWLDRAYSEAIAPLDIGLLQRNRTYSDLSERLLLTFFNEANSFVDFGAGYGVFVRMMRDKGFDFKWYDKHCENIFAKEFDCKIIPDKTDVITAFEVFEHLSDPKNQLAEILNKSSVLIFSTDVTALMQDNFKEWGYRAPHSGQHVSFFSPESLHLIAKQFNRNFYSNGSDFHFFSTKKLNDQEVRDFFHPPNLPFIRKVIRRLFFPPKPLAYRATLLMKDHAYLTDLYMNRKKNV